MPNRPGRFPQTPNGLKMWNQWIRNGLLILSVILAFLLIYLLTTQTETDSKAVSAVPRGLQDADAGIDDFTYVQSRDGAVQWEVQAKRAHMFESEHRALLQEVEVTLFGEQGWELKVFGDEGTIDTTKKDFMLITRNGQVTVRLESGYTIYTNRLAWSNAQRAIKTSDPVLISGHGMEMTGKGLLGFPDSEEFRILEDVRVELQ